MLIIICIDIYIDVMYQYVSLYVYVLLIYGVWIMFCFVMLEFILFFYNSS